MGNGWERLEASFPSGFPKMLERRTLLSRGEFPILSFEDRDPCLAYTLIPSLVLVGGLEPPRLSLFSISSRTRFGIDLL